MKKIIKILTFSFGALIMFAFSGVAHASFNENIAGTDCSVAGIAIAGQSLQRGCANYQDQIYGTYGQVIDVNLYYRNTSGTDAQNARGTISVVGNSSGYTFTNSITSSVGGAGPKTVTLTLPSDAEIEFNGAKVYQRRMAVPENQTLMKSINNASELNSFALGNGGTVESYLKCQSFGDSFCYQGFVVATFTIVRENVTPPPAQICYDYNAQNYGAALPCIPKVVIPICYDVNSTNYGSTGPCIPKPICYDVNSTNYGSVGPCIPKPIIPICYDTNAQNYGSTGPCIAKPMIAPSVSTLSATNITSSSCKFNAIINISSSATTKGYFKYGTTTSLNYTSLQDTVGTSTGRYQFADVITGLAPSTTYYYRAVATNQYGTREGELRSCKTKSNTVVVTVPSAPITNTVVRQTTVRPITTTIVPEERIVANSAPSLLFLRIDDRREDLTCADVVDYQVVYKNVSNIVLERAILEVQLPAGVVYVKSSAGGTFSETTNTVTFDIGTVMPGQEDAKFIQADVNCLLVDSDMLVANASMSYTNPQTLAQEEAVAYDLDKFFNNLNSNRTNLTGAAIFGAGFLPNSLLGWLILILIILGLIYVVRLFMGPAITRRSRTTQVVSPTGKTTTTTINDTHDVDTII